MFNLIQFKYLLFEIFVSYNVCVLFRDFISYLDPLFDSYNFYVILKEYFDGKCLTFKILVILYLEWNLIFEQI